MNRVTTKVQDLETLKRAQTELEGHALTHKANITIQVNQLKNNIFGEPEENQNNFDIIQLIESALLKTVFKKFFKSNSKIGGTISSIVSTFIVSMYGKKIQKKLFKLTNRFLVN